MVFCCGYTNHLSGCYQSVSNIDFKFVLSVFVVLVIVPYPCCLFLCTYTSLTDIIPFCVLTIQLLLNLIFNHQCRLTSFNIYLKGPD